MPPVLLKKKKGKPSEFLIVERILIYSSVDCLFICISRRLAKFTVCSAGDS
jgi:hypothetical protein